MSEACAEGHYEPYGNLAVGNYYHYRSDSEEGGMEGNTAVMTGMRTAYDGQYAPMLVPWSVLDPEEAREEGNGGIEGYGRSRFLNYPYEAKLRVEKLDRETGEPILHEEGIFALYRAKRNESPDGDGEVMRYETDTVVTGSREFLKAMGAGRITPLARNFETGQEPGTICYGTVPADTPICREEDLAALLDENGLRTGIHEMFSTVWDGEEERILQTAGYFVTSSPLKRERMFWWS